MPLPSDAQACLMRANELGYFPTPAQAKRISAASAGRYGKMIEDGTAPRSGHVAQSAYQTAQDWAIRAVMEEGTMFQATVSGVADEAMIGQVADAIRRASGRNLRVRIEEV